MANIGDASARLRKTFKYPDDDHGDSDPDAMDEEEQDRYIARLAAENTTRNTQFRAILLVLPIVSIVPYLPGLLGSPAARLISILSITSLLSTAYLLHSLPLTTSGFLPLDNLLANQTIQTLESRRNKAEIGRRALGGGSSPLEEYLPWLNLGLVVVLGALGTLRDENWEGGFRWIGMGNLPGIVFWVVVIAKAVMQSVDPEAELSGLKYGYKGA